MDTFGETQAAMRRLRPEFEARFARKLGAANLTSELFDFGTQLGVAYSNPKTGRRWAARIPHNATAETIDAAIAALRDKTGDNREEIAMRNALRR